MGKSSILASKVIAPDNVVIHNSLEAPDIDYDSTLLLFPDPEAVPITEMSKEDLSKIKTTVLIDSTWNQTKRFMREDHFKKMKKAVINTEKTLFWRYQKLSDKNLATIEALYFFIRDYMNVMEGEYDGRFDDLLYYFSFNYAIVQNEYKQGLKKDKRFGHIKDYIKGRQEPYDHKSK